MAEGCRRWWRRRRDDDGDAGSGGTGSGGTGSGGTGSGGTGSGGTGSRARGWRGKGADGWGSDSTGAALAMRRRQRRWRSRLRRALIAVVVLGLLGGGVWLVFFSAQLRAERVEVAGVQTLNPVRVRHQAEVPLGGPLARVDLSAIQARVESMGAVESAEVSRAWPHTVRITVLERTPVAVVDRGTQLQQVDRFGVLFGIPGGRPRGLPLIKAEPSMGAAELAGAAAVAAALPPSLAERTDAIELRSADQIVLRLADGRTVLWGSATDSEQKADVAAALLRDEKAREIDVSVPGRPTTRG